MSLSLCDTLILHSPFTEPPFPCLVLDSAALYIQIWSYINTIHDPLVRQIIALRYIDGLPWQQVANNIGGGISADHARILLNRYLAANAG